MPINVWVYAVGLHRNEFTVFLDPLDASSVTDGNAFKVGRNNLDGLSGIPYTKEERKSKEKKEERSTSLQQKVRINRILIELGHVGYADMWVRGDMWNADTWRYADIKETTKK